MIKKNIKETLFFAIGLLLLGLIYEIIVIVKNNSYFAPHLNEILSFFFESFTYKKTWIGILNTLLDVLVAILISFSLSIFFAVISYKFEFIYKIFRPMILILRCIPIVILINVIWFILSMQYKNLVVYLSVFSILFPIIYEALYQAIKSIDRSYIDVYKINSNLSFYIVFRVYIPLVSSSVKSSIINAIGIGIKVALSVEFIVGLKETLGYLIKYESNAYTGYVGVYAYILILILLSILLEIIFIASRYVCGKIKENLDKNRILKYEREKNKGL